MTPIRIAIIGYGKIARDQHRPAIDADPHFVLTAVVNPVEIACDVPCFPTIDALRLSGLTIDAVAICTPPAPRFDLALQAIDAGWDVLLEKPPAATLGAIGIIQSRAHAAKVSLFVAWHSRFQPAVDVARNTLREARNIALNIEWFEDVHRWHPDQRWIWEAGGFGVFDPGINALAIATAVLPDELVIAASQLEMVSGCQTPIAADLSFAPTKRLTMGRARFDWRARETDLWVIRIDTDDMNVELLDGGELLLVDGQAVSCEGPAEYPALYERFATLIDARSSEVDSEPLRLVADALLVGEVRAVSPCVPEAQGPSRMDQVGQSS